MAEPPITDGTPREGEEDTNGDDAKSQKSGPKSQTGSKPPSRIGSAQSKKSGKSDTKKASAANTPAPEAAENPAADWRNMRRIIAEDPEWSLATVPLLVELSLKHVISNFENNSSILDGLLPKHKVKVLEKISTDVPLKITANLVSDEGYWKRCCKARWEICDISAFGDSWKRMYFERNLQDIIEHFIPETTDTTNLNEALPLSANFVKKLEIRQLLPPVREAPKGPDFDDASDAGSDAGDEPECDHFNFGPVLKQLPNLEELHVTYGVKDCGMNFEWNLFQFTARDCLQLAQCIAACKNLKVFCLHRSKVDDDKVRVLISHILDHPGLTELDLSHNIIGDRGARAVGKFINNHSQLVKLNLCDNQIRSTGAQAIAHALTKNTTLLSLNLRLNRLGDEGGQAICRSLLKNATLSDKDEGFQLKGPNYYLVFLGLDLTREIIVSEVFCCRGVIGKRHQKVFACGKCLKTERREINLGSNEMAEPTASILSSVVLQNMTLKSIDLSCNRLGPDGGKQLQEGMEENSTITTMDLRLTECGQESEYCINQRLHANQEKERESMLIEQPILSKKIKPQAAHRFKPTDKQKA